MDKLAMQSLSTNQTYQHHRLANTIHLTLKMTSVQVIETSVTKKRVSMGLTVRRKTAKNLAVRRKNERILAVSRKKNLKN